MERAIVLSIRFLAFGLIRVAPNIPLSSALICVHLRFQYSITIWETAMSKFQLFDAVSLTEPITLTDRKIAPPETAGAIVEIFNNGEAYLVELFGGWVKAEVGGDFIPATQDEPQSFMETIGVETVYPHQLRLVKSAREIMGVREQLMSVFDNLPDELVAEVCDFAEFLEQKQAKVRSLSICEKTPL